jgi:hypothetical protein
MNNLPPIISFKVRGLEEVERFLKALPRGTMKVAIAAMSEYILGDDTHGLRHYPPRRSHGAGNPYRWQSEKQRRAFFATKGFGKGIPSRRSYELSRGWQQSVDPYRKTLFNRVPYAKYVMGNQQQIGHTTDGWRKIGKVITDNVKGGMLRARQAVAKWIANKGK